MKKQLMIVAVIIILLIVGFIVIYTVTPHPDKSKFIGTWQHIGFQYTFEEDGTYFSYGVKAGNWNIKDDGRLELHMGTDEQYVTVAYDYVFSNNNTTLTLTLMGGTTTMEFTKQ